MTTMTTIPCIDPPVEEPGTCGDYIGYRPGDRCPLHTADAICGQCRGHVTFDRPNAAIAVRVWGYRLPEPSVLDGVETCGPEWWCPPCAASFELSHDLERCRECGDAFHPDMEHVHGGVCDDCEKGA